MRFWSKVRWWLTPLGLHEPERPDTPPVTPQASTEPHSALSDDIAHISGGQVLRSTQWHKVCQVHDRRWHPWMGSECEHPDHEQEPTK